MTSPISSHGQVTQETMTTNEALQTIWKALKRPPIVENKCDYGQLPKLIANVARRHGLTTMQILGTCKRKPIAEARQEAYCVVRFVTGLSYSKIGKYFGRCHDTVMRGIEAHQKRNANMTDLSPLSSANHRV